MPAKDSLVYIMHIRDSCRRIAEYTTIGGDNWTSKPMIMDAVCRNITIIGEAARKLDDSFQRAHPEIPWSGIIGARNIVTAWLAEEQAREFVQQVEARIERGATIEEGEMTFDRIADVSEKERLAEVERLI